MRFRPIASLSVAAVAVLLLAGCSGSSTDAQTPDATATPDAGACQTPFTGDVPPASRCRATSRAPSP